MSFNLPSKRIAIGLLGASVVLSGESAIAQDVPATCQPDGNITNQTVSQSGLTDPSLWWIQDQFIARDDQDKTRNKVVQCWKAYANFSNEPPRVDFVVNRQQWSLMDYIDRYAFLHEFGAAAQTYGYAIRVLDPQGDQMAAYYCPDQTGTGSTCDIWLNVKGGRSGFRGRSPAP